MFLLIEHFTNNSFKIIIITLLLANEVNENELMMINLIKNS